MTRSLAAAELRALASEGPVAIVPFALKLPGSGQTVAEHLRGDRSLAMIEHAGRRSVVTRADAERLAAWSRDPGAIQSNADAEAVQIATATAARLEQLEQQQARARAQARQQRERTIARKMQELREGGHAHHTRAHAIHVLDNQAKWAAQTAAHQARMAAASTPAEPAAPATARPALRLVPTPTYGAVGNVDLQNLTADFGRRI